VSPIIGVHLPSPHLGCRVAFQLAHSNSEFFLSISIVPKEDARLTMSQMILFVLPMTPGQIFLFIFFFFSSPHALVGCRHHFTLLFLPSRGWPSVASVLCLCPPKKQPKNILTLLLPFVVYNVHPFTNYLV